MSGVPTSYVSATATLEVYEPAAYQRLFGYNPIKARREAIRDRQRDEKRAKRRGYLTVVWCERGSYYLSIKDQPLPAKCQPATMGHGDTPAD